MVEPSSEKSTITAAMSSQPLSRSRFAKARDGDLEALGGEADRDEGADRHDEDDDADLAEHPADRLGVDELGTRG